MRFNRQDFSFNQFSKLIDIKYIELVLIELNNLPKLNKIIQPILDRIEEVRDYLNNSFESLTFMPQY